MQRSPKLDRLKSTKYKRALFVFFAGLRLQRREFGAGVVVVVVSNGSRNATPRVLPRRDTFTFFCGGGGAYEFLLFFAIKVYHDYQFFFSCDSIEIDVGLS